MYTDTLTRIKNGVQKKMDRVKAPYSKLDMAITESLAAKGYIESATKKGRGVKKIIEIKLKYDEDGPAISGIKFISKPSRKIYIKYQDMQRSRYGLGNFFISTSKGIMTEQEARKNKVGGKILFEIW